MLSWQWCSQSCDLLSHISSFIFTLWSGASQTLYSSCMLLFLHWTRKSPNTTSWPLTITSGSPVNLILSHERAEWISGGFIVMFQPQQVFSTVRFIWQQLINFLLLCGEINSSDEPASVTFDLFFHSSDLVAEAESQLQQRFLILPGKHESPAGWLEWRTGGSWLVEL